MNISVVIPVYNGVNTIEFLVERLAATLPSLANTYEVILVEDGSPDASWRVVEELAQVYPWVNGISLMRNYGQHNAVLCGVHNAQYEVIVTMDDDLQHAPEQIHLLLEKLAEGYDVVYGVPRKLPQSWWRNLAAVLTKKTIGMVAGNKVLNDVQSFRAFRTDLRRAFEDYQGPEVMLDAMLTWSTTRFASVEVEDAPRTVGISNYNMRKLIKVAFIILTNFSTAPLRLASITGFIFTLVGLAGVIYVLASYFLLGSLPGFSFLATSIIVFGGVQLFAIGIIGEYLARMFERSSGRKPYTIRHTTGEQGDSPRI